MSSLLNGAWNFWELSKRFYDYFFNPTPMNVDIPQKDENGNIVTVSSPNRAMSRKIMWDDVGGALGQFDRTFYVDAENGDDSNIGNSVSSPFKTVKKAIDSAPVGSVLAVYLLSSVILEDYINIKNKQVVIHGNNNDFIFSYRIDKDLFYSFSISLLSSSSLLFSRCNIVVNGFNAANGCGWSASPISLVGNTSGSGIVSFRECSIVLESFTKWLVFAHIYSGAMYKIKFMYCDFVVKNDRYVVPIIELAGQSSMIDFTSCTIKNEDGSSISSVSVVSGVIRDADSGNPINLISNINFSD